MEEALGLAFEGEQGDRFFRSTLIQTLFYGIFSAWVLWHRERPTRNDRFDWRVSAFLLRVPVIQVLYNRHYFLGPLIVKLASDPMLAHKNLIVCAYKEMARLAKLSEETVSLVTQVGIYTVCLDEIESQQGIRFVTTSSGSPLVSAGIL